MWNENIGTQGAWDATHCTTVITEQTGTTCECATFGTFAVVAELVEEPTKPDEYMWLKIIKYCGFGFSIVCVLILVIIIATSSSLHDMFHLLRMHLGVSMLLGIIVMICAQQAEFCVGRENRHTNIALSALHQT